VSSLYGFEAEAPGKRKAFTRVHNLWRASEAVGALALSPRLAGAAATLLGVPSVRLYQVTCSPCVARDACRCPALRRLHPSPPPAPPWSINADYPSFICRFCTSPPFFVSVTIHGT
jgi:hypothetical protein